MQNSQIEWTDHTFNPWWGCLKISPACDHCYAETMARRMARRLAGFHDVSLSTPTVWGRESDRLVFTTGEYWNQPLRWDAAAAGARSRRRVFCGSMCDIMERNPLVDAPRRRTFELIERTPNLDWVLLTKRPQEYRHFLPKSWLARPRHNVWLMTTVEHADYRWRIGELLKVDAVVHGLSCEPLLGPVDLPEAFLRLGASAWVIAGGESGKRPRPSHPAWFRMLRDQCVAAGVPFFFKQWGECNHDLLRIGKKSAGRILDGTTWDQIPAGASLTSYSDGPAHLPA